MRLGNREENSKDSKLETQWQITAFGGKLRIKTVGVKRACRYSTQAPTYRLKREVFKKIGN